MARTVLNPCFIVWNDDRRRAHGYPARERAGLKVWDVIPQNQAAIILLETLIEYTPLPQNMRAICSRDVRCVDEETAEKQLFDEHDHWCQENM